MSLNVLCVVSACTCVCSGHLFLSTSQGGREREKQMQVAGFGCCRHWCCQRTHPSSLGSASVSVGRILGAVLMWSFNLSPQIKDAF